MNSVFTIHTKNTITKSDERIIKSHDENIARIKARYEEMIREAEERLKRDLEFEAEKLAKAEAILNGECE